MRSFEKLVSNILSEIDKVFQQIDKKEVLDFLNCLQDSKRIFLLGVGREGLATRAFAMRLMHLGKEVYWIWDDTTPGVQNGDLFICTSGSSEIKHEITVCQEAKNYGAKIVLITASKEGEIHSLSDSSVIIPAAAFHAKGNFVATNQLMGNLFEQSVFIFFDIISMMLKGRLNISDSEMEMRHRNVE